MLPNYLYPVGPAREYPTTSIFSPDSGVNEVATLPYRNASDASDDGAERSRACVAHQADLVLLRGNPLVDIEQASAIEGVVLRGAWLPRERLDAIRAAMRELRER